MYGIASNLISRQHRAEQRHYRALARLEVATAGEGHVEHIVARVDAAAVRRPLAVALARLAKADREVLLLVAWAELTRNRLPSIKIGDPVAVAGPVQLGGPGPAQWP